MPVPTPSDIGLTSHGKLRASVRRFRRESLLRQLGVVTAAEWDRTHGRDDLIGRPLPWATSLVAREALVAPSTNRAKHPPAAPSVVDVNRLADLAADLAVPDLDGPDGLDRVDADQIMHDFSIRSVYQQWPYSTSSAFGDQSRIRPMFDRPFPRDRFEVLSKDTLANVLGGALDVFVDSAAFFGATAWRNHGLFNEKWLSSPRFAEVRAEIQLEELISVFRTAWSASLADLRHEARQISSPIETLRQFDWNPLRARPFVRLTPGDYVAPQVRWAQTRVSPTAIYHLGQAHYKEAWARDLGKAQEDYIVLQLKQLEPIATVIPEVEWTTRNGSVRSVDAIVVFDDCTVLVESKSLKARVDSTTDFATYSGRLDRDLIKVFSKQVPRTVAAITSQNPAFAGVPSDDRPIFALVVTPEPLYLANVTALRRRFPDPGIPYAMVSLTELEHLVSAALGDHNGGIFRAAVTETPSGDVSPNDALKARFAGSRPSNPILHDSAAKTRWKRA